MLYAGCSPPPGPVRRHRRRQRPVCRPPRRAAPEVPVPDRGGGRSRPGTPTNPGWKPPGIPRGSRAGAGWRSTVNDWKWQTRCPLLQGRFILSSSCDGINGEVVDAVPRRGEFGRVFHVASVGQGRQLEKSLHLDLSAKRTHRPCRASLGVEPPPAHPIAKLPGGHRDASRVRPPPLLHLE